MATLDDDIEQDMHRMLERHNERLEWFRYNDEVESTIIARMTPTKEWFTSRNAERRRRRRSGSTEQMGPVNVALMSQEQRDSIGKASRTGKDCFGSLFGIPDEASLNAVVRRAQKAELLATRRSLSQCRERVQSELDAAKAAASYERTKVALFALALIKNWRRRIGLELGAVLGAAAP